MIAAGDAHRKQATRTGRISEMPTVPETHLDILESPALAYMATLGPKGDPQVSPVWFLWDGSLLRFAFNKKRQKYRNLLRDPRVSVSMADPANPYRALEIRGVVVRMEDDPGFRSINAASRKYLNRNSTSGELGAEDERVVIVVNPERVIAYPTSHQDQGTSNPDALESR